MMLQKLESKEMDNDVTIVYKLKEQERKMDYLD